MQENQSTKAMNFIWTPDWTFADHEKPQLVLFRRSFILKDITRRYAIRLRISADTRYKLYLNGRLIQEGPAKGDLEHWYADRTEITSGFRNGENVLSCLVLRYPEDPGRRNHSMYRTAFPCLYVEGLLSDPDGVIEDLSSGHDWLSARDRGTLFQGTEVLPAPIHHLEEVTADPRLFGWQQSGYDDSAWKEAVSYDSRLLFTERANPPFALEERTIPLMRHKPGRFSRPVTVRENTTGIRDAEIMAQAAELIRGEGKLSVPAHSRLMIELDAGAETCGYLKLAMEHGTGAEFHILSSEGYSIRPVKGDRTDHVHGRLEGYTDIYRPCGLGTAGREEVYEPFFFRTFRYLGLTVETGEEALELAELTFTETGYPLEEKTQVSVGDAWMNEVYAISERTLRCCMHETYMDCPFYEQLQYAMDARAQILFTYSLSMDDRLARQCMEALRRSKRADGMINCCAPSVTTNVIPGFSIFYIQMVYDHMMYFGDRALVQQHLPTIEEILGFFERHLEQDGMVGRVGGILGRAPYWSFIDWCDEWELGTPAAGKYGKITMESLLYLYGLISARELLLFVGRNEDAGLLLDGIMALRAAVRRSCRNADGLITDGPGRTELSVHCQVFSILTGVLSREEGASALQMTFRKEDIAQCTIAMVFYLLRAMEQAGIYGMMDEVMEPWRQMLADHLTTCPESNRNPRSDCHAWSAAALYEVPAVILGVRPAAPGYQAVRICPNPGPFRQAEGDVAAKQGMVHVEWTRDGEKLNLRYSAPEGVPVVTDRDPAENAG